MKFPSTTPDIQVVYDQTLAAPRTPEQFAQWEHYVLQNHWTSGALNIYFAGWVLTEDGTFALGITQDPADDPPSNRPFLIMNDGGFFTGQEAGRPGFLAWQTPAQIHSYRVLEHEIAHFLLRRTNCPAYSAGGEHVPNTAQNQLHLLRDGGVPPGFISHVPFSEQGEIRCRYSQGVWNAPSPECTPSPCP
jgi:hypothetical protein